MPKPEKEPAKEITEKNRKLAEEFEKVLDSKMADMDMESDTIDILPVEQGVCTTTDSGNYVVQLPVGFEVTKDDISTSLTGHILTILLQKKTESGVIQEIGKMLTLPENVDLNSITTTLTSDGNLKIQVPLIEVKGNVDRTNAASPSELALILHNEYRKKHGVRLMTLNVELAKLAETYAKALSNGTKVNLDESNLGLNIFEMEISKGDTMEAVCQAVGSWYDHKKDYKWDNPKSSGEEAKKFYEIIWKSTIIFGAGVASSNERIFVVALYNRNGKDMATDSNLKENVLPSTD